MVKLVPPKSMATPQIRNKAVMLYMKSHTQTCSEPFCVAIDRVENKNTAALTSLYILCFEMTVLSKILQQQQQWISSNNIPTKNFANYNK